MEKSRNKKS